MSSVYEQQKMVPEPLPSIPGSHAVNEPGARPQFGNSSCNRSFTPDFRLFDLKLLISIFFLILGIVADQAYQPVHGHLGENEQIVLTSDGVPEAQSQMLGLLGFERLAELTRLPANTLRRHSDKKTTSPD